MNVVFHDGALRGFRAAYESYAAQGAGKHGERLLSLVDTKAAEIGRAPESFPRDPNRSWARRARILEWPSTLIFTALEGTVVVLAVAHGKRKPGYWAKRRS